MALHQQKAILGWILQICLLVVLSNPTGVAGWDFSSLVSFSNRSLRGSQPQEEHAQEDPFDGFEEDFEMDYNSEDFELNAEDYDADVPSQEERELHPSHGGHWRGYYGRSYYGVPYRATNVYYPYNPGYYGGYYRYYGYGNRYYGGYRRFNYGNYRGGYDDWIPQQSNFWI